MTGAGRGIGEAVARAFAEEGADVALLARSKDDVARVAGEIRESGATAIALSADVTDEEAVERATADVTAAFGDIHVLVTCAAGRAAATPSVNLTAKDFRQAVDVDLTGTFLSCRAAGRAMLSANYGRIVNVASFHAIATYPERAAYAASKAGVVGLTQALAMEWAPRGVTVNAVAPGPIRTPRTNWFLAQSADVEGRMLGRTPAGRLGEVGDVAAATLFLASPEARHIVGQTLVIDGGWTKSAWFGTYGQ